MARGPARTKAILSQAVAGPPRPRRGRPQRSPEHLDTARRPTPPDRHRTTSTSAGSTNHLTFANQRRRICDPNRWSAPTAGHCGPCILSRANAGPRARSTSSKKGGIQCRHPEGPFTTPRWRSTAGLPSPSLRVAGCSKRPKRQDLARRCRLTTDIGPTDTSGFRLRESSLAGHDDFRCGSAVPSENSRRPLPTPDQSERHHLCRKEPYGCLRRRPDQPLPR
jgi:hypothetical protein